MSNNETGDKTEGTIRLVSKRRVFCCFAAALFIPAPLRNLPGRGFFARPFLQNYKIQEKDIIVYNVCKLSVKRVLTVFHLSFKFVYLFG
jgi:hypothetical protein